MILLFSLVSYLRSGRQTATYPPAVVNFNHTRTGTRVLSFPNVLVLINFMFAGIILALLAYYVIATNAVIAGEYSLKGLNDEVVVLQEQNSWLASERINLDISASILNFAKSHGMVEAREIVRVVAVGNVALH